MKTTIYNSTLALLLALLLCNQAFTQEKICTYTTEFGSVREVDSIKRVPSKLRHNARCTYKTKNNYLASPDEIELEGSVRREVFTSPLGKVTLKWPRSVEGLFGKTPLRATIDAARTVSKTIKKAGFPLEVQNFRTDWNIIFMDENVPDGQIPTNLITNCNPGWMTPPGNIYIVAQRVVAGCQGRAASKQSVADSVLAEVLVHEMGHAIEFQILGRDMYRDRSRAEGFATWFEMIAAKNSSLISHNNVKRRTFALAKEAIKQSPNAFIFDGTAYTYSRAALYPAAIENRLGVSGLMEIYTTMDKKNMTFYQALNDRFNWSRQRLEEEVIKLLE